MSIEHLQTNEFSESAEDAIVRVIAQVKQATEALIANLRNTEYYKKLVATDLARAEKKMLDLEVGEERFARKVLVASYLAKERYQEGIALFDLDETLVRTRTEGGSMVTGATHYNTLVRPGASAVLAELKKIGFSSGLLTSRGPSEDLITEAMNDPKNLAGIKRWIDTSQVYSMKDAKVKELIYMSGFRPDGNDAQRFYDYLKDQDMVVDGLSDHAKSALTTYHNFEKISILTDLHKKLSADKALIVVDDLEYVRYLDPQHGLYGVELPWRGDDQCAFFPDTDFIEL
jgi:hypothetical protein